MILSTLPFCSFRFLVFFLICSVNDFITAYLAIELQGLAFYILASFKKPSNFSVEGRIKYFVLGFLSTALFFLGITIIVEFYPSLIFINFENFFIWIFSAHIILDWYDLALDFYLFATVVLNSGIGLGLFLFFMFYYRWELKYLVGELFFLTRFCFQICCLYFSRFFEVILVMYFTYFIIFGIIKTAFLFYELWNVALSNIFEYFEICFLNNLEMIHFEHLCNNVSLHDKKFIIKMFADDHSKTNTSLPNASDWGGTPPAIDAEPSMDELVDMFFGQKTDDSPFFDLNETDFVGTAEEQKLPAKFNPRVGDGAFTKDLKLQAALAEKKNAETIFNKCSKKLAETSKELISCENRMKKSPIIRSILAKNVQGINNKGLLVIDIPVNKLEQNDINLIQDRNESAFSYSKSVIELKKAGINYKKAKFNCNKISGGRFPSDDGLVHETVLHPSSPCLKKIIRFGYEQFAKV